jgi:hypothetical protein
MSMYFTPPSGMIPLPLPRRKAQVLAGDDEATDPGTCDMGRGGDCARNMRHRRLRALLARNILGHGVANVGWGNLRVGVFATLTNSYALTAVGASENFYR